MRRDPSFILDEQDGRSIGPCSTSLSSTDTNSATIGLSLGVNVSVKLKRDHAWSTLVKRKSCQELVCEHRNVLHQQKVKDQVRLQHGDAKGACDLHHVQSRPSPSCLLDSQSPDKIELQTHAGAWAARGWVTPPGEPPQPSAGETWRHRPQTLPTARTNMRNLSEEPSRGRSHVS